MKYPTPQKVTTILKFTISSTPIFFTYTYIQKYFSEIVLYMVAMRMQKSNCRECNCQKATAIVFINALLWSAKAIPSKGPVVAGTHPWAKCLFAWETLVFSESQLLIKTLWGLCKIIHRLQENLIYFHSTSISGMFHALTVHSLFVVLFFVI